MIFVVEEGDGITNPMSVILGGLTVFFVTVIIGLVVKVKKLQTAVNEEQIPQQRKVNQVLSFTIYIIVLICWIMTICDLAIWCVELCVLFTESGLWWPESTEFVFNNNKKQEACIRERSGNSYCLCCQQIDSYSSTAVL